MRGRGRVAVAAATARLPRQIDRDSQKNGQDNGLSYLWLLFTRRFGFEQIAYTVGVCSQ